VRASPGLQQVDELALNRDKLGVFRRRARRPSA
jgi:hypothetical protein